MDDYSKLFKDSVEDFLKLLNESDFIKKFFVILVDMIQFGVLANLTSGKVNDVRKENSSEK